MRFGAECAKRHGLRAESSNNRSFGFDFFQRDRRTGREFELIADGNGCAAIRQLGICGIFFRRGRFQVRVHAAHEVWRSGMFLTSVAETVEPGILHRSVTGSERADVRVNAGVENVVEASTAQAGGGVFEKFLADFFIEADGFEQVAIAIARNRGNSHARENFAQPGFDGNAVTYGAAGF